MNGRSASPRGIAVVANRHILAHAMLVLSRMEIPTDECILILSALDPRKLDQLREVIRAEQWREVIDVFAPRRAASHSAAKVHPGFFVQLVLLRRGTHRVRALARQWPQVEAIVSGVYAAEIDRTLCSLIDARQVVIVDDGNMTLFTGHKRAAEHAAGYRNVFTHNSHRSYVCLRGRLKAALLRHWGGVIDQGSPNLTFFTSHKDMTCGPNDQVLVNDYGAIDRDRRVESGLVHFLGLPAIRRNIFSPEVFARLLTNIREFYRDSSEIVYFAHPAESEREKAIVAQVWPEAQWRDNQHPYETELRHADPLPERIGSFYSSALTNILAMRIERVTCDVFRAADGDFLVPTRAAAVKRIYDALADRVSLVELSD